MTVRLYVHDETRVPPGPKFWRAATLAWPRPALPMVLTVANRAFVRADAPGGDGVACYLEGTCCDAS